MTARRRIGLRLRVDPVACDAYGYCAELLPERVTLDEWGYPMVDGTPVEHDLVELAVRAAAECPRRAVLLEEVTVVGLVTIPGPGRPWVRRVRQSQTVPDRGSPPPER